MPGFIINEMVPITISILALVGTIISIAFVLSNVKEIKKQQEQVNRQQAKYKGAIEKGNENDLDKERHRNPRPVRSARGGTADSVAKARIEWMNQTKQYTGELLTYSTAIFQASKRIIQNNIEIKEKNASNYTYKDKNINIAKYNENLEKFKITKAKLLLSYATDSDTEDIHHCIETIDNLRRADYGTQIHSNIERHEEFYKEYSEKSDELLQLSAEYFDAEWDKVKNGR